MKDFVAGCAQLFWVLILGILRIFGFFDEKLSPEEKKRREDMYNSVLNDKVKAATVFTNDLMASLPNHLKNFHQWLSPMSLASEDLKKYVYIDDERKIFEAGKPYSEALLDYGLTPVDLFGLIHDLDALLCRAIERGLVSKEGIWVDPSVRYFLNEELQKAATIEAGRVISDSDFSLNYTRGLPLLVWILEVLKYKPLLFPSFRVEMENDMLRLVYDTSVSEDFEVRWKVTKNATTH